MISLPYFCVSRLCANCRYRKNLSTNLPKYQRIFWRSHSSQCSKCYELQTVTYGTSSAPFLATGCLNQLAIEYKSKYLQICDIITNDFYVDDSLTGAESIEDLLDIKIKVNHTLICAGFDLRKWLSNFVV